MLSNDVKVWTAIHATIDACARTSSRCDSLSSFGPDKHFKKGKG